VHQWFPWEVSEVLIWNVIHPEAILSFKEFINVCISHGLTLRDITVYSLEQILNSRLHSPSVFVCTWGVN
jgi:hypothetical protein